MRDVDNLPYIIIYTYNDMNETVYLRMIYVLFGNDIQ